MNAEIDPNKMDYQIVGREEVLIKFDSGQMRLIFANIGDESLVSASRFFSTPAKMRHH